MSKKRIAIVGAGLSGLSVCYYLLQNFSYQVTLFDKRSVGGGSSGIAAGLLHSHPGKDMRLSWKGEEALLETEYLLGVASRVLGRFFWEEGIFRLALQEKQKTSFFRSSTLFRALEWKDNSYCMEKYQGIIPHPGVFMHTGKTIDIKDYLTGLFLACQRLGAKWKNCSVSLSDLTSYDQIVIAANADTFSLLPSLRSVLRVNKGQMLTLPKPQKLTLTTSVIGDGYLVYNQRRKRCYLGSTYEHHFCSKNPCLETARVLILNRASRFISVPIEGKEIRCISGMRVVHRNSYCPVADQVTDKIWVFTGLGSRGLLYHAYLGKILASAIASGDRELLPKEIRIKR